MRTNNNTKTLIEQFRVANNLSQKDLAAILKISHSTVASYEKRRRMPKNSILAKLIKIANDKYNYKLQILEVKKDYGYTNNSVLAKFRDSIGFSQQKFAGILKTSQGLLSTWERRKVTPTAAAIIKIYEIAKKYNYQLTVSDLIYDYKNIKKHE